MTRQEKQAEASYERYQKSSATQLSDVYGSYSNAKHNAFIYCQELCNDLDGKELKIISHSGWIFTAGFTFFDKETGELKFMYITPNHNTAVSV